MPAANKGKGKGRDGRRSRSRNTTPSSGLSIGTTTGTTHSGYLENDVSKLFPTSTVQYADILERYGSGGSIPDSKTLDLLSEHLKQLSQMADARGDICNAGMRELSLKRKEVVEEQREQEMEVEKGVKLKREADDDDDGSHASKGGKLKKRKERPPREDRPLAVGAHEVTRQDGGELGDRKRTRQTPSPSSKRSHVVATGTPSPPRVPTSESPAVDRADEKEAVESDDSDDSHQPEPAPAVQQYQIFGPNPLKFPDPTIYHIREVTPNMTDEEKKEIYSVASFPKSDLSHLMAGTLPDKDFSNSKPSNQVSANTFASYVEPYVRPLTEEDIAFLKERGDRTTPFVMPRRGKKHYTEIWAEEDGTLNVDQANSDRDRLPLNQGRGSIDQITDEVAETDKVSVGPLVSRLYSMLRYEHRAPPDENTTNGTTNGTNGDASMNGVDSMDVDNPSGESSEQKQEKPQPVATAFPDASPSGFKVSAAKLEHAQLDERLKAELRYVGFLGPDDNPDFDAHYDDDIAQRLRLLQSELKKQMIINGARKARLLELAKERMAYQEYMTIHDDLDAQVQQAYLKRTRTLGKSKKGSQAKHRPGGAGGGSHVVSAAGVGRPGIGDVARTLMDRRKRWRDCIGPVFKDSKTTVPGKGETIFDPAIMKELEKAELEGWDEEQE